MTSIANSTTCNSNPTSTSTPSSPAATSTSTSNAVVNRRLASSLLRDYYSLNSGPTSDPLDPDSGDDFNDELAFEKLLEKMKLAELMAKQASILAEIRELDGERQSLVYNHHHELVAASETIRTMKTKSSTLSPSLNSLQSSLSKVKNSTSNSDLTNSSQKSNDEAREKLLKEIRPILILPQRLNDLMILRRSPNSNQANGNEGESEQKLKANTSFEDPRKLYEKYKATLLDWEENGIKGSKEIREACEEVLKNVENQS